MKRALLLSFAVALFILGFRQESESRSPEEVQPVRETELRAASTKALALVQRSQAVWNTKETCTSCHHQVLPTIAFELAGPRGIPVDEPAARDAMTKAFAYLKNLDAAVQGYDYIDVFADSWSLVAAHAAGVGRTATTDAYAQFIASHQLPDGSWSTIDGRPPQAHSLFTSTAVAARAMGHYLPERLEGEKRARLQRAGEWLMSTRPRTTEDRAFQLLGLRWTGAGEEPRKQVARLLLAEQRPEGGWSQLPGLASDAYATGEVLVALREGAGMSTADPVYQRGLRFLLKTQKQDGSWHVPSRLHPPAPVSPPYFETGFPYGHDQFISITGTSWALVALLHAIPPRAEATRPAPVDVAPAEKDEWVRVAASGSAAELAVLLDAGMKPDAATAAGTTALMLAARDAEKVRLLLDRGADVNARAATGVTALMVASRYRGNAEVVRVMLRRGATPNARAATGVEVRNDASALFYAVMARDVQTAAALVDAGARLASPMKLLGRIPASPLFFATVGGDADMVEFLISKGADPNEVDGDGISALGWAAINNHGGVARALLARGAKVNHRDKHGMTPLLYAASIDYGDTAVIETLIAAGADRRVRNKRGLTAHALAKAYRHAATAGALSNNSAHR
jgi:ankyrin repeat protein